MTKQKFWFNLEETQPNLIKQMTLAGYQIADLIYDGSRTQVYRGLKIEDSKSAILKKLRKEYPTFNELLQFRHQYVLSKNLDVPGIVKPIALEKSGNGYVLVMEDVGGVSLSEYIRDRPLSIEEFLEIAIALAKILEDLNRNRVIHKDIKPANILINPETKEIYLIDFSISSLLPRETQEIQNPNVLEGTLAYISPEQTGRMNRGIDYRSDFYSLGVTFYQLLTGELPFKSDDPMELVHCHIAKTPIPPHQVKPDLPQTLSEIAMKLMAKTAEERYQSALGIKQDLEKCWLQWQETGSIAFFELGERDISDRFIIPEKLYGRETEVQTLLSAFDRLAKGQAEIMLVAGFSGIGKTAVVNEVHKPIVRQRGYFIKGKFDQFQRNIPFSAFLIAFRDLMEQLLAESDAKLAQWQDKIIAAVGENAQVIIDVIPELELLIGKQPSVPELSGSAAQNRFNLLFQKFIKVFTTPDHPLVIFVDDLQWADSASLQLMQLLTGSSDTGYLLLLGAYRDNEVFPAHPLMLTLDAIGSSGATINTITLVPLSEADLNCLVADTLSCTEEVARPLSELIYQKTKGNPFFATQFLKGLHEDGFIAFNRQRGHWLCDMTRVRQLALTEDVVEFMATRLYKLPSATQEILKLAACIGNQFDLETLAIVSQQSQVEAATCLWVALQEGLILPKSETYKFFQGSEGEEKVRVEEISVSYKFLHDRVQQAAYSLIPEEEKQATHLQIGQLWLQNTPPKELEDQLFPIVNQLNIGVDLITHNSEIQELVRLNRMAGNKATAATAYEAAIAYFNIALQFLTPEDWTFQHDLAFALHLEAAKAEYLGSNFERSHALLDVVLQQAQTLLEQLYAYEQKMEIYLGIPQFKESIETGLYVLELVGVELEPEPPERLDIEVLRSLPVMTEPERLAVLRILNKIILTAALSNPKIYLPTVHTGIDYCIKYGNSPLASYPYSCYGVDCCDRGEIELGYQLGQFAVELVETSSEPALKPMIAQRFSGSIQFWKEHIRASLKPLLEAFYYGLENGELLFSGYCILFYGKHLLFAGEPLDIVKQKHEHYLELLTKQKLEFHVVFGQIWYQLALNLLGLAEDPRTLTGPAFNEAETLPILVEQQNGVTLGPFHAVKSMLLYLFNAPEQAIASAKEAKNYKSLFPAFFVRSSLNLYDSLAHLALCSDATDAVREEYLEIVATNQQEMQHWATHATANYQHKFDLVEAERYRVNGQKAEAIELYDRAIAGAKENEYLQEEALANELAAKFYLEWGKEKYAALHMQEAYYGYARWGAKAKTDDLEKRYRTLLAPILEEQKLSLTPSATLATMTQGTLSKTTTGAREILDLATLMKASRTLSEEIELSGAIANLMQVARENAGAETVALIDLSKIKIYAKIRID